MLRECFPLGNYLAVVLGSGLFQFLQDRHMYVLQHVSDIHWIGLNLQLSVLCSHIHCQKVTVSFTFQSTFQYFQPDHARCCATFISIRVSRFAGRGGRFLSCFKHGTCSTGTQPGCSAPFRIKALVYQVWKYSLTKIKRKKNSLHKIFRLPCRQDCLFYMIWRVRSPMMVWWQDQAMTSRRGDISLSHETAMGSLHHALVEVEHRR